MSFMIDEGSEPFQSATQKFKKLVSDLSINLKSTYKQNIKAYQKAINTFQLRMSIIHKVRFQIRTLITLKLGQNQGILNPIFHFSFTVGYKFLQNIKNGRQLAKEIRQLKSEFQENMTFQYDQNDKNLCHFYDGQSHFNQISNIQVYLRHIQAKIKFIIKVCDKMDELYKNECVNASKPNTQKMDQNEISQEIMQSSKELLLVVKQLNNFQQYFTDQDKKHGFLKNPEMVQCTNQIARNIIIDGYWEFRELSNEKAGSYSRIYQFKCMGQKDNTLIQNRKGGQKIPFDPNLSQDRVQLRLIWKTIGGKYPKGAQESFQNQVTFLTENGGLRCPFVNNYYWEMKKKPNKTHEGDRSKIISDFQPLSASYFFLHKNYTMSDIINFTEQLLLALRDFYLSNGFLHRDIKAQNIMINHEGVIKIIDHGSVYPFYDEQELKDKELKESRDRLREKYHSTRRSSLFVGIQHFNLNQHGVLKEYPNYSAYCAHADTHKTFDVYSVGEILNSMVNRYQKSCPYEWMEVSHRWNILIEKMMKFQPSSRIEVKDALAEIRKMRKIFLKGI